MRDVELESFLIVITAPIWLLWFFGLAAAGWIGDHMEAKRV